MNVSTIFINILNVFFICIFSYICLKKKRDTSLFWLFLSLLYFYNIPLLVDSFGYDFMGDRPYNLLLSEHNQYWNNDNVKWIDKISLCSLAFNIILYLSYRVTTLNSFKRFSFPEIDESYTPHELAKTTFFPFYWYVGFSLIGLALFFWDHGLTAITVLGTGNFASTLNNRFVTFFQGLFLGIASVGVVRGLLEKKYLYLILIAIPIILVGYMTEARARIISLAFFIIWYFLWIKSSQGFSLRKILFLACFLFLVVFVLTSYRGGMGIYPIAKDFSYADLYNAFRYEPSLSTAGEDTKRLLLTGFYNYQAEDITYKLADYMFFVGWGSLHPTLLGWCYIDLGEWYWLIAVYFGFFLGIVDKLRHKLSSRYNLLILPFIFIFTSVAARGSVQYAYAAMIYPFLLLVIYFLYTKFKKELQSITPKL